MLFRSGLEKSDRGFGTKLASGLGFGTKMATDFRALGGCERTHTILYRGAHYVSVELFSTLGS